MKQGIVGIVEKHCCKVQSCVENQFLTTVKPTHGVVSVGLMTVPSKGSKNVVLPENIHRVPIFVSKRRASPNVSIDTLTVVVFLNRIGELHPPNSIIVNIYLICTFIIPALLVLPKYAVVRIR